MNAMARDPLLDFEGQVALVTGAASGLGALLAAELGARGARLVLGDRDAAGLERTTRELSGQGVSVVSSLCDVSAEADCAALVQLALDEFGSLDLAVNNAGVAPPMALLEDCDDSHLDPQININLKGVFYGLKHQLRVMKPRGAGVILNVSSMAGLGAAPRVSAYSASKHAVIGLTRTAAVESAAHGVRVNAVCPFFTLTPMVTGITPPRGVTAEQQLDYLAKNCPMRRLAQPAEVVAVMLMLLSPAMSYLTGQAIAVDGGFSAI